MKGYEFTKIQSYDPYNRRANAQGIVTQWRVESYDGSLADIADTKKEAIEIARRHNKRAKAV